MAKVYDEWINKITKLREEMREYEKMVSRMKREKETDEDQDSHRISVHQHPHQCILKYPDRQGEDSFLLCRRPRRNDHHRHGKAAELFAKFDVPIMRATSSTACCRPNCCSQNIPAYLQNRLQMQDKYLDKIKRRLVNRWWRMFRSWSAT